MLFGIDPEHHCTRIVDYQIRIRCVNKFWKLWYHSPYNNEIIGVSVLVIVHSIYFDIRWSHSTTIQFVIQFSRVLLVLRLYVIAVLLLLLLFRVAVAVAAVLVVCVVKNEVTHWHIEYHHHN